MPYYHPLKSLNKVERLHTINNLLKLRSRLGDFNIPKVEDDTMKALEKYGFTVPSAIKEHPTDLGKINHYDQIAFNLKLSDNMTVFSAGNTICPRGELFRCPTIYRFG
jgi:hypothetical protein